MLFEMAIFDTFSIFYCYFYIFSEDNIDSTIPP
nr:MAG TPA: hypothetical protein [Caudoviricetes sp.]